MLGLELELYAQLLAAIEPFIACIQANAAIIAQLDCLLSFARHAQRYNYRSPDVVEDLFIDIKGGRHPVIE